eukprot:s1903_g12.t1
MSEYWVPWDELLDSLREYHLFVADVAVREHLTELATAAENHLQLCPDQTPYLRRDDCQIFVHFVSGTQLAEALADASQRVRALENRVAALEAEFAAIRQFWGI